MASSRLRVPVYRRTVVLVDDKEEAKRLRAKYRTKDEREASSEEADSSVYGNCAVCGKRAVVMFVNRAKKHPGGILATVVHESVHAAGQVLEIAGVNYGPSDDEQLAYLTDWLYTQWCRRMESSNGK